MTTTVPLNPEVITWAIREGGWSHATLAAKLHVEAQVVADWASGAVQPTPGEWTSLAAKLKRPKSIFFLSEPPASGIPPDLRTSAGRKSGELGPDELLWVRRAQRLQRALLDADGELSAVALPRVDPAQPPVGAANVLREWLGLSFNEQLAFDTPTAALDAWQAALERFGVIVMRLPLGGQGIRGFSLRDSQVPVIAISTAEIPQARSFTLMHELAHLASGTAAACALPPKPQGRKWPVERWCDRVAAMILLPEQQTSRLVERILAGPSAPSDDLALVMRVANRTHISLRASALRLTELGLVERAVFGAIERLYPKRDRDKGSGGGGGGGAKAPEVRLREFGLAATGIVEAVSDGRLHELQARRVLRLDGHELGDLGQLVKER